MMTPLDTATLPLQGRHLIEASAGTGKTFAVANLYLRLLIDARDNTPYTVENILVVTFTKAATEELRARLRARIELALSVLDGDSPADADVTLHAVLNPHLQLPDTRARLELAYQCMDQAAIFTIHSFCDRVLREQAFESGELFDAELQTDADALSLRAAQSWWRHTVTPLTCEATEAIPKGWRKPGAVLSRLSSVIADPAGQIVPVAGEDEVHSAQQAYESAWQCFSEAWKVDGADWAEQIRAAVENKQINKSGGKYTIETVEENVQLAENLAQQNEAPSHIADTLSILGNTVLEACTRKGKVTLESALGARVDTLVNTFGHANLLQLVSLQCSAKAFISTDLARRKQLARERTFDDLLLQLHRVLYSQAGERLTDVLRGRFPVALIDEFQDTDRVQYEIFDRLYPVDSKAAADPTTDAATEVVNETAAEISGESHLALYLIGDPKQSIYRFRGADIDIYIRARSSTNGLHSIDKNWRSSSRLINALNTLYAQSERPFGSVDIQYQAVTAGGRAEGRALTVGGETLPPLQFEYLPVSEDKLPNIGISETQLAQACARRVAWLLNDAQATLGDTPLRSKDIAVLVWTHAHAQKIRQALSEVGVGSAMQSRENVLHSPEALDILALLRVLARQGDSASLSRVLVSPLGGYTAEELLQQRDDAVAWQIVEDHIDRCRDQCRQAGPLAAVLRFMALFNTRTRAAGSMSAGVRGIDRMLGNYLHLAEVLQTAWQDQPDLRALLQTAQRLREQGAAEALQIRLESDEALVQIVTVHKSKGLQYPVVMLPFACMGKDPTVKGDAVVFTDNGLPRLDVGSDQLDERRQTATRAQADETLRTLYVALTRAEQSCWIGVTANKNVKYAALWKLLDVSFPVKADLNLYQSAIAGTLIKLQDLSADIAISEPPVVQGMLQLSSAASQSWIARTATRKVYASWRVGSYSALARGATYALERPDHDAMDVPVFKPDTVDHTDPFHFPRGADAGTLIHAVFEHLDFCAVSDLDLHAYVERHLRTQGVDTVWAPALCCLVRNALDTPLTEGGFTLGTLDHKDRLDELGFHFPVSALQDAALTQLLQDYDVIGADDGLQFERLDGYMTGFIDLTFRHQGKWYIADYKSNHLGYTQAQYNQAALTEAMQHHRYDLQYLIYSVALRRYLSARLPGFDSGRDFGGVFYLFVRGMPGEVENPTDATSSHTGVYRARPPEALLQALDQLLGKGLSDA